jgi:hypothetical protein
MRTGDDGTCTWRCAGNGILLRGHGPKTRSAVVLDVAKRLGVAVCALVTLAGVIGRRAFVYEAPNTGLW